MSARPLLVVMLMWLCLCGCKEGGTSGGPSASASAAAAPSLSGLVATVNGERLPLRTAVAYSRGGAGVELDFSTATLDCDDFAGNGRMLTDGERHFSLTIGPMLVKGGGSKWSIGEAYFDSHTKQGGDIGELTLAEADPVKGVKGELSFELELKANEHMNVPARKLVVKGPFAARGCGVIPPDRGPPSRPQKNLTLKVVGKRFSVDSATVRPTDFPSKGHELLLSTASASCDRAPSDADLTLKLNLGASGAATFAHMAGNVLSSQLNASPAKDGPTITAVPKGSFDGDGPVAIALSGELDVLGYAVTLDGSVEALRCPEK